MLKLQYISAHISFCAHDTRGVDKTLIGWVFLKVVEKYDICNLSVCVVVDFLKLISNILF